LLKIMQDDTVKVLLSQKLSNVQAGFRKRRGKNNHIANICWIMEKASECQKNIYLCFSTLKALIVWLTTKCDKFLRSPGTAISIICLLRNLYADQETKV
ncbi:hypothetical protein GN956_G6524, partial [Arapaima gigas]